MKNISLGKYNTGIYRHVQIIINNELNPYGLGSGQYIFLGQIAQFEGITQKELTEAIKIDKATTAKAVKKLMEQDYIYRIQDESDKRYYKIYLTKKGKDFVPILRKKLRNVSIILSKGMNEDQIDKASELLEIMLNNAVSAVEDLKKI